MRRYTHNARGRDGQRVLHRRQDPRGCRRRYASRYNGDDLAQGRSTLANLWATNVYAPFTRVHLQHTRPPSEIKLGSGSHYLSEGQRTARANEHERLARVDPSAASEIARRIFGGHEAVDAK
ncbi:hypothetical protein MTO96_043347 [Rhipicephalus appendiculatus]